MMSSVILLVTSTQINRNRRRENLEEENKLYKKRKRDKIWWVDNFDEVDGYFIFTFDKKTYFNMFRDYPYKLTPEQKAIFDKENPFWANFFKDRCE